jgi:hypothetical protein
VWRLDLDDNFAADVAVSLGGDGRGGIGKWEHRPDGEAQCAQVNEAGQFGELVPVGFNDEVQATDAAGGGGLGRGFVGDTDQYAPGP